MTNWNRVFIQMRYVQAEFPFYDIKTKLVKLRIDLNHSYTVWLCISHLITIGSTNSTYSSLQNRRACTIINFGGKSLTYMSLFGPTRLLILRKFSNVHVYSILHDYLFWRKISTMHTQIHCYKRIRAILQHKRLIVA